MPPPASRGFTLVEVLVALAVLGLAVLALLRLGTAHVQTALSLERAALADIAAENALIEALIAETPPAYGEERLSAEVGGTDWTLLRTAERTAEGAVMIVRVEAYDGAGRAAAVEGMRRAGT